MLCLTCGESKTWKKKKNCQTLMTMIAYPEYLKSTKVGHVIFLSTALARKCSIKRMIKVIVFLDNCQIAINFKIEKS